MTNASVEEITALEDRRWAAQIEDDADALAELLSDELSYTHSTASVDDKTSYIASITEKKVDYRAAERLDTSVAIVGQTAVVTGRAVVDVEARGREIELNIRYSAVWAQADGQWRFVCWQSTPIPA